MYCAAFLPVICIYLFSMKFNSYAKPNCREKSALAVHIGPFDVVSITKFIHVSLLEHQSRRRRFEFAALLLLCITLTILLLLLHCRAFLPAEYRQRN